MYQEEFIILREFLSFLSYDDGVGGCCWKGRVGRVILPSKCVGCVFVCTCVSPLQRAYWSGYREGDAWCPGALPDPEIVRMVEARKSLGEVRGLEDYFSS